MNDNICLIGKGQVVGWQTRRHRDGGKCWWAEIMLFLWGKQNPKRKLFLFSVVCHSSQPCHTEIPWHFLSTMDLTLAPCLLKRSIMKLCPQWSISRGSQSQAKRLLGNPTVKSRPDSFCRYGNNVWNVRALGSCCKEISLQTQLFSWGWCILVVNWGKFVVH